MNGFRVPSVLRSDGNASLISWNVLIPEKM